MRFLKTLTVLAVSCSLALPPAGAYAQLAGGVGEFNLPSLGNVAGADLTVLEERSLGELRLTISFSFRFEINRSTLLRYRAASLLSIRDSLSLRKPKVNWPASSDTKSDTSRNATSPA